MEEKAEKPKRPDNSLPLIQSLITRTTHQNQVKKKTNKQTNKQDNYTIQDMGPRMGRRSNTNRLIVT